MTNNNSTKPSKTNNLSSVNELKYTLANPPNINNCSFVIEANFLRHFKTETIPNLEQYIATFNCHDWSNLLAHNPRQEFIELLDQSMPLQIDWVFVKSMVEGKKEQIPLQVMNFIIEMEKKFKRGTN